MYGLEATLIAHLRENEAALLKDNSDSASIGSGMLSCDYSDWSNIFYSRALVISQAPNHIAIVWPHVVSINWLLRPNTWRTITEHWIFYHSNAFFCLGPCNGLYFVLQTTIPLDEIFILCLFTLLSLLNQTENSTFFFILINLHFFNMFLWLIVYRK